MAALSVEQKNQLEQELARHYREWVEEARELLGPDTLLHFSDFAEAGGSDQGDESVADALADIAAARADRQVAGLREIEAARLRLKQGSYGICEDCGETICFERLLAYPAARRCISCQAVHEKTHASENTPSM